MSKRCCVWMKSCKERKNVFRISDFISSSEGSCWYRCNLHVLQPSRGSFQGDCFVEHLDCSRRDDGSTVADVEQEEKKGALRRRPNYFSHSVENIRTRLPGFATVSVSLPCPEQSLINHMVLEHSLHDIKRVVCRKLGLADDLDVQLTQTRGNSSIVLEDGNDIHHPPS